MKMAVIIGAGGHAKVVIDILQRNKEYHLVGCTDPRASGHVMGIPVLGDDLILSDLQSQGVNYAFVALGDNRLRKKVSKKLQAMGFEMINAIGDFSYISDSATVGKGVAIMPGAIVNAEAVIHDLAIINTGASVDHECVIGEACHIAPGCNLSGNVTVSEGSFLGTGTKVIESMTIGSWSVLGSGSVVVKDFPEYCVGVGIPARVMKRMTKGGNV